MTKIERIFELRAMLDEINRAADITTLSCIYLRFVGYDPFESPDDDLDDLDDVRMTLTDYLREMACSVGVHWMDVVGGAQ
jgi:hypothetical protein